MYDAPFYKGSGKLKDKVGPDHRRRFRHRPRGGRAVRARGRGRRHRLSRRGRGRRGHQGGGREGGPALHPDLAATSPTRLRRDGRGAHGASELGGLDILVNNAAFQVHVDDFEDLTDEHFDRTLKTNLYGYFHMAKAAVPHMKPGSAIVMTGSVTGLDGQQGPARLFDDQGRHPRLHPRRWPRT